MIRKTIKMSTTELPESTIQAVWNSIDLDGNGWIDAGEFGRFFRLGEKPMADTRRKHRDKLAESKRNWQPEFREPTLAEVAIENSKRNKLMLDKEEEELRRALRRSAASLPALKSAASVRSLPPLR